jgi:uncharacterized membrane protein (Fun14 family)
MATDLAPFAGTVGRRFFNGFITGYAIKKVIKLAAVIVGLFIATLAYLQYQRILNFEWERVQAFSQNAITWVVNALTHITNTIDGSHSGILSNTGIPLVSSVSAGFVLGMARG